VLARVSQLQQAVRGAYDNYEFHLIYQKVHNFCAVDMGSFYLDIIKDRQYTAATNSVARRSAQTAMYHTIEALVRWIAPIMSFTAEDIWRNIPGTRGESVLLETWYQLPQVAAEQGADQGMGLAFWEQVITVREAVSKELEKARVAGDIGSSLDAEVDLYCDEPLNQLLASLEDELRFVLITSYARVHPTDQRPAQAIQSTLKNGENVWIQVTPSVHQKCVRCWHHRADVGSDSKHPELCGRCIENVDGDGETRRFA
jgi:isoleucyl-tRNA synthetase